MTLRRTLLIFSFAWMAGAAIFLLNRQVSLRVVIAQLATEVRP